MAAIQVSSDLKRRTVSKGRGGKGEREGGEWRRTRGTQAQAHADSTRLTGHNIALVSARPSSPLVPLISGPLPHQLQDRFGRSLGKTEQQQQQQRAADSSSRGAERAGGIELQAPSVWSGAGGHGSSSQKDVHPSQLRHTGRHTTPPWRSRTRRRQEGKVAAGSDQQHHMRANPRPPDAPSLRHRAECRAGSPRKRVLQAEKLDRCG